MQIELEVNGTSHTVAVEPRRTLVDALRHNLQLTGTKKVCDMGNCGACTVMVDGRAMYSCLLLAVDCEGREIMTIEGLDADGTLAPTQRAFIEADAFQCGFCTAGQIMSLHALLQTDPDPADEEILRAVTGNLCRCGAYRHILEAGRQAASMTANQREDEPGKNGCVGNSIQMAHTGIDDSKVALAGANSDSDKDEKAAQAASSKTQ